MATAPTNTDKMPVPVERRLPPGQTMIAVFAGDTQEATPVRALVKHSSQGILRAVLTNVPLSEARKEVCTIKGRKTITALGFQKANQFVGVSFFTPSSLTLVEGPSLANPFFERDGREILSVTIRKIGIGCNAIGNMIASDLTLRFDLANYFAQSVYAKWYTGETTKDWAQLFPTDKVPAKVFEHGREKVVPCGSGICLVVDLTNREVVYLFKEQIEMQRFAGRRATTMVERNILRRFVAASEPRVAADRSFYIPVVGWHQVDRDFQAIAKVAARAQEGKMDLDGDAVQVERAEVIVDDPTDVDAALAGEADEDTASPDDQSDAPAPGVDVPDAPQPPNQDELDANFIRGQIRDLSAKLSGPARGKAFQAAGIKTLADVANCTDPAELGAILSAFETVQLEGVHQQKGPQHGNDDITSTPGTESVGCKASGHGK